MNPWSEEATRQVMRLLAYQGQRNVALAHYNAFRDLIRQGIGRGVDAGNSRFARPDRPCWRETAAQPHLARYQLHRPRRRTGTNSSTPD
ncbi:MAG: hypothetical protein H6660_10780 [Ardenticatenaceae bacterium]|nr:hypothetical protein [Ardenticatenaceae bacterium]